MTPFALGVIMLIYLRERKVYGGFRHWILANFGLSLGYLFTSLRGVTPPFFSMLLGNGLIIYSIVLIYEGIEQFYDRPAFNRLNYVVLGVYTILLYYFIYWNSNVHARVVLSSLAICLLVIHAGSRFFHCPIPELARTSRAAGYVFFLTGIFPWILAITSLFVSGPIAQISQVLFSWFSVFFIVSIVVWTFYFFFITSARLELDLETTRAKVELISRTDSLTNLYNRRHFDEQAEIEFQRSKRSGRPHSILLLDIDGFKSINDVYGHAVGDTVLKSFANVLRSELRPFDLIARYGGDEFIILLTETSKDLAYAIAERLRKRLSLTPFVVHSQIFAVTLSAGIATIQPDDDDLLTVIRRGDKALYRAKEKGRNCVIIA